MNKGEEGAEASEQLPASRHLNHDGDRVGSPVQCLKDRPAPGARRLDPGSSHTLVVALALASGDNAQP